MAHGTAEIYLYFSICIFFFEQSCSALFLPHYWEGDRRLLLPLIYRKAKVDDDGPSMQQREDSREVNVVCCQKAQLKLQHFRRNVTTSQKAEKGQHLGWPCNTDRGEKNLLFLVAVCDTILTEKKERISGLRLDISSMSVSTSKMSGGRHRLRGVTEIY